jgi:hypothetical protein
MDATNATAVDCRQFVVGRQSADAHGQRRKCAAGHFGCAPAHVRAAHLAVLVNDTDWALLGTLDYVFRANDRITFISTLHGG